jgi:hypothetical protein
MDVNEAKYKVPEVAKITRKSEKAIWAMVANRQLGVIRFGRSVLVPESELRRCFEQGFTPARNVA